MAISMRGGCNYLCAFVILKLAIGTNDTYGMPSAINIPNVPQLQYNRYGSYKVESPHNSSKAQSLTLGSPGCVFSRRSPATNKSAPRVRQSKEFPINEYPGCRSSRTYIRRSRSNVYPGPQRVTAKFYSIPTITTKNNSKTSYSLERDLVSLELKANKVTSAELIGTSKNNCHILRQGTFNMPRLVIPNVRSSPLYRLPKEHSYSKTEYLNICNKKLTSLPSAIYGLGALISLNAQKNYIERISHLLFQMPRLQHLNLECNRILKIPEPMDTCYIRTLCLSENCLRFLPQYMSLFPALEILDVSHNKIQVLPIDLFAPLNLRTVLLDNNLITDLPEFYEDNSLVVLNLACNRIRALPSSLNNCKALQILTLESNELTELYTEELVLPALREFIAPYNKILSISDNIRLPAVEYLNLSHNMLTCIPTTLQCLSHLKVLDISHNMINVMPKLALSCMSLKKLDVSFNRIEKLLIPHRFPFLEDLNISNNPILEIPYTLGQASCLKKLDISYTSVRKLPKWAITGDSMRYLNASYTLICSSNIMAIAGSSASLENIDLECTGLVNLPKNIKHFKNLWHFNISCNKITTLPSHVFKLPKLTRLLAGNNRITSISIKSKNYSIEELSLPHNNISVLPKNFKYFKNLKVLDLSNNELIKIPDACRLFDSIKISQINLSHNKLKSLPMPHCPFSLQRLNLAHNCLRKLPQGINSCINLVDLNLSNNEIDAGRPEYLYLYKLERLNLDSNKIADIELFVSNLKKLQHISINNNIIVTLPKCIFMNTELLTCSAANNHIEYLPPPGVTYIGNLKELDLSSNRIKDIPRGFKGYSQLRKLILKNNFLNTLSAELCYLPRLNMLDISGNRITEISSYICKAEHLNTLIASGNCLRIIPVQLFMIPGLRTACFCSNMLQSIRIPNIRKSNLEFLNLSRNMLHHIPVGISRLAALKTLDVRHNMICDIKEELFALGNLNALYLCYNSISTISKNISKLKKLNVLRLTNNCLTEVCTGIERLGELKTLTLRNNYIQLLPSFLWKAKALRELDMHNNKLKMVEGIEGLSEPSRLEILTLSNNFIFELPNMSQLKALRVLNIENNKISQLPNSICKLHDLEELRLCNNKITSLPQDIRNLKKLKYIDLRNNMLESVPRNWEILIARGCIIDISGNPAGGNSLRRR